MKFALTGATGKMGLEIRKVLSAEKKLKFVGGLSRHADKAQGIYSSFEKLGTGFDVLIDFSTPEVFSDALAWAVKNKKAFFSGTTGLSAAQKKELTAAGKKIAVLWAPNTAPGVHIVKKLLSQLDIPESFDVQLTEYHHNMKKDRPSGTAVMLQDELNKKRKNLPEPISIRGGGIFGIHRIELMSQGETITIEHQALGRHLFAKGAVDAAAWLGAQKKSGVYTVDNFLESFK